MHRHNHIPNYKLYCSGGINCIYIRGHGPPFFTRVTKIPTLNLYHSGVNPSLVDPPLSLFRFSVKHLAYVRLGIQGNGELGKISSNR